MWWPTSTRPGRIDRKRRRGSRTAGKRRAETHLFSEALEGRALLAVNVFDINGTWRRGISDPGALTGTLSVDTDTGRVSAFNLLRTGGIKENTGYVVMAPPPKLLGGTPLPAATYGLDSITFQGIKNGQYRVETALRGGYSMTATWQLPTGSLSTYAGGAVTFSFTSSVAYASSNLGSGTLKLANGAPFDIALSNSTIPENSTAGTRVGLLSTSDPDVGDTFTYALVSGSGATDNASFQIVGNELRANAAFDFEAKSGYTVRIRTTDRGGLSYEEPFTINVTDVNEPPFRIVLLNPMIPENSPVGTAVGLLSTIDPDVGDTFTYALVSGSGATDNASFQIVGNELRSNAAFDFEAKNSYTCRIRTTDRGGNSLEQSFAIMVTNANEAPGDPVLSKSSIAENSPVGTVVGLLSTIDPDVGDTFTYALVSGSGATDNASFQIVGNELRTNAVFDFEAKRSYSVRIRTTDRGGMTREKSFVVMVTNVNEAPTDIVPSTSRIPENSPVGTVVGRLSTIDPDVGDTFTYTLVAGGADNASFQVVGNELRSNAAFDFEAKSSYTIRIRTTDRDGLSYDKLFTITVTDVADDDLPKDFLPGVPDQLRRDAWRAYQGDRKIDRNEMIALLRKTGESDGVVTGPEVAGLRRITAGKLGNSWEITMDDYVRNLAGKVVENQPAGGATAERMSGLVGKWFEGKDLPSTVAPQNSQEAPYQMATGQLFVGSISWADVKQGRLSDCYFLATLAGVADTSPQYIRDMFIDNGDGTWTVGFFNPDPQAPATSRDYVTVDRRLPTDELGRFIFASIGGRYDASGNELWVALAEKAYAQWAETGVLKASTGKEANAYRAIESGYANHAVFHVTGAWPTVTGDATKGLPTGAQAQLDEALKNGHMVMLGTKGGTKPNGEPLPPPDFPFTQAHVYFAPSAGPNGQNMYRLVNPYDSALTRDFLVSWDQVAANFNTLVITGTRGAPGSKEFYTLEAKYAGWKPDVRAGGTAPTVGVTPVPLGPVPSLPVEPSGPVAPAQPAPAKPVVKPSTPVATKPVQAKTALVRVAVGVKPVPVVVVGPIEAGR